jgi:hypothetical protein
LKAPFLVPLNSVDHFISSCHSPRPSEEKWENFTKSVAIVMVGPIIEQRKLEAGLYGESLPMITKKPKGDELPMQQSDAAPPTIGGGDPRKAFAKLDHLLNVVTGCHRKRVNASLHALGIHLALSGEIDEARRVMEELGIQEELDDQAKTQLQHSEESLPITE